MAFIYCPECHDSVSTGAETCPHCGYPIKNLTNNDINNIQKQKKKRARISWIIILFVLVMIVCSVIDKEEQKQSESIKIEEIQIEYPTDVLVMTLDEIAEGYPVDYGKEATFFERYIQFTAIIKDIVHYSVLFFCFGNVAGTGNEF